MRGEKERNNYKLRNIFLENFALEFPEGKKSHTVFSFAMESFFEDLIKRDVFYTGAQRQKF